MCAGSCVRWQDHLFTSFKSLESFNFITDNTEVLYIKVNLTWMHFCLCVSRSPTWRMILTGTQLSSTTRRGLCPKTTSTYGPTRKRAHTRVFSPSQSHTNTSHMQRANASPVSVGSSGGFSVLLWTSALWHKASSSGATHSLAALRNHTRSSVHMCVCVCVVGWTVPPSDPHPPAGFYFSIVTNFKLSWQPSPHLWRALGVGLELTECVCGVFGLLSVLSVLIASVETSDWLISVGGFRKAEALVQLSPANRWR